MRKKIDTALLFGFALLMLASCSPKAIYEEIRTDLSELELRDFWLPAETVVMPFHLTPDETDNAIGGTDSIMLQHPHRELFASEQSEEAIPTAPGYIRTAPLLGIDAGGATTALSLLDLEYSVKTEQNSLAAGLVYAVEYAGVFAAGEHYINPDVPITLYVSGEKLQYPEATAENTVYLTFDDGPGSESTTALLDVLDSYGIKGTFFLLGDAVVKNPDGAKEIIRRGHDVACHSMSHAYTAIYESSANLMAEIDEWVALMEDLGVDFSETPKMFRYPGGSVSQYLTAKNREEMNKALLEREFLVYDWSIVVNDALLFQCPEGMSRYVYIIENFLQTYEMAKKEGDPLIILFHDNIPETPKILSWIIEYLAADGATFAPLSSRDTQWTFADRKNKN